MLTFLWILLFLFVLGVLCFQRASMAVSAIAVAILCLAVSFLGHLSHWEAMTLWIVFIAIFVPFSIWPIRRQLFSRHILRSFRKVMPTMSATESEALSAGTVGWTGELFSGMPDWHKLQAMPGPALSEEEQAFMDGPVEELCRMIDDWKITQSMTIPDKIWNFLKANGFFALIIPKEYGGKKFSAVLHSSVIVKVSALSASVATVIGVPNSLGPPELLVHYGTQEQKDYYLPRLAKGEEMPCFALTSPVAGSDAGAITDHGVIFKAEGGELKIRLNWNKRYITLAPMATVLALAFKLYDPDHLLGEQEELGITVALIPTDLPGVTIGRRHYPLHCAFPNGPIQGDNVEVSIDRIIGGQAMVGQGWRMLMECLAAGRAISLPSIVTGGARKSALASGAYGRTRRQFNTYIANFGGVGAALTRVAAYAYATDATRLFALTPLDHGEKPVVESAISKYHCTEMARQIVNDAMDVQGGKGVCMGPGNYLAQGYIELPISVTVEGANILTRSMIIFGQGAMRCHPFVLQEMQSAVLEDPSERLKAFDKAVFSHLGFIMSNKVRSLVLGLTGGRFAAAPRGPLKGYYQQFSRFSSAFALTADMAMATLGGKLKRMENISARLGDVLSYLFIGSAVLKHFELGSEHGPLPDELPIVEWLCQDLLYRIQQTFSELFANMPNAFIAGSLRALIFPLGKRLAPPSDKLSHSVASLIVQPNAVRKRFAQGLYMANTEHNPLGFIEELLPKVIAIEPLEKKVVKAVYAGKLKGKDLQELTEAAVAASILTADEGRLLLEVDALRMQVINVDDFAPEFFNA